MSKFESGLITYEEKGSDKTISMPTAQCVHCGKTFYSKPPKLLTKLLGRWAAAHMEAEGRTVRGFCTRCCGPVCGPGCADCIPEEQLLENYEKHRPLDFRPIVG